MPDITRAQLKSVLKEATVLSPAYHGLDMELDLLVNKLIPPPKPDIAWEREEDTHRFYSVQNNRYYTAVSTGYSWFIISRKGSAKDYGDFIKGTERYEGLWPGVSLIDPTITEYLQNQIINESKIN